MRHHCNTERFGRSSSHRKAMFANMVTSLFLHERILTTLAKAKELRRHAERLITMGKRGDLAARRMAAGTLKTTGRKVHGRKICEDKALGKLFGELGLRFANRRGGYTRIIRVQNRRGDNAPMAFVELLPKAQTIEHSNTQNSKNPRSN